jgi:GT2 family glycosyltransferase
MNSESCEFTVSVIIVSWNAREYLMQCLASLSAEEDRLPMEIIVVDNASSDGSADEVAACYPDVRLIRNTENLGFAKANNMAVSVCTGKYLCFVNSDVKVLPHCVSRLVSFCEENPDVAIAGPRVIGADGKLQRSCLGFPTIWNTFCRALALDELFPRTRAFTGHKLYHWPQESLKSVDVLTGCFWLVRREALTQVGLLDEEFFMYAEDMDWCKRFWAKGWKVFFVPSAEAIHYGGASSSNAPVRFYLEMQRANLQYWKKHHSRFSVASYFVILCMQELLRAAAYSIAALIKGPAREVFQFKMRRSATCLKWLIFSGLAWKFHEPKRSRNFQALEPLRKRLGRKWDLNPGGTE